MTLLAVLNAWEKAFDSPHEAQAFYHDCDVQGSDSLDCGDRGWWWDSDDLQFLVPASIPSRWIWTLSHERTSGFVELDFVTSRFVFLGWLRFITFWGAGLFWALLTDLTGFRFFRGGSDFCLPDGDFGCWYDRLFWFRKRDCFCFTGFDKEKRRSYQPPKSSSGKQKSEPPRKKRKPAKSVSKAQNIQRLKKL